MENGNSNLSALAPQNPNPTPWLNAWYDPLSNLRTHNGCIRLGDVYGDGDAKLIVCDFDKKVKIYKGTALALELSLLDVPVGCCVIYSDAASPRIPNIAIGAGNHIFIYRQMRPFRKWTCPPVEIPQSEIEVWNELKNDSISIPNAIKSLNDARENGSILTHRSTELLSLDNDAARNAFVQEMKYVHYVQQTLITCMEELSKDSEEPDGINHLVVGTESRHLYVLHQDPSNSSYICRVVLPAVPVMMSVFGMFDIEWRAAVACRDGKIYVVKNGEIRGTAIVTGTIIDLCSQVISMAKQDKLLWVATMDRTLACYTPRGKRTKSLIVNEDISQICVIAVRRAKVSHLLLVAVASGEIRMFRDSSLVYTFTVDKPVLGLQYGSYGREESTLVAVHGKGSLTIKIWKRAIDADSLVAYSGPPPEQDIPLPVPKKTKVYVEQSQREREQAISMHKIFQKDLCRLRLETARAYVKTLTDGYMGATPLGSSDIRVQAQVLGLGPSFILKITIQNATSTPFYQGKVMYSFDPTLYKMDGGLDHLQCTTVPVLLPGIKHILEAHILSIDPQGRAGQVLVVLHQGTPGSVPLLSASVKMPIAEPML